jgi:predicted TPR repeat methyltransferase
MVDHNQVPHFVEVLQRDPASRVEIPCPLCGGVEHAALYEGVALRGNDLRLVMCQDCSHLFINPRPNLAAFEDFYEGDDYFHLCAGHYEKTLEDTFDQFEEDEFWEDRGDHGRRLHEQYLRDVLGPDDTVFDFGCGDGGWLWGLRQVTGCRVAGLEISKHYVRIASEKLGVEIFDGPVETAAKAIVDKHRDAVKVAIVSGSLQHMLDPLLCLSAARDILVDNGLLYVCNWSIFDHFMRPYQDQPQRLLGETLSWEHTHYFHETSFKFMAAAAGFEIVAFQIHSTVRERHMEFLARKTDEPARLPSAREVERVAMRAQALESATLIKKLREITSMPQPEHQH